MSTIKIKDPITNGLINLIFEKDHDAEYYRVPPQTTQKIQDNFGLSRLRITDLHISCVKNSFHVTMETNGISFHIGIRPNTQNTIIEFWPMQITNDLLKTYRDNIFDALYYTFESVLKENKTIPDICGNSYLGDIRNKFKKFKKQENTLMSPSALPQPPRTPLRTPLSVAKRLNFNELPASLSPKATKPRSRRSPNKGLLSSDSDNEEEEGEKENSFRFGKLKINLNLKILKKDLKIILKT